MSESTIQTVDTESVLPSDQLAEQRIVLFDGVCGLCSHAVDYLLRHDPQGRLRFAPLQGTTASRLVPHDVRDRLDTMVYSRQGVLYYRSAAVVRMLRDLGGLQTVLGTLLWIIPGPLRDVGYRCVSTLRYRLFGKHETCRMPTPQERARFLD